jgi:hypothetical protein
VIDEQTAVTTTPASASLIGVAPSLPKDAIV